MRRKHCGFTLVELLVVLGILSLLLAMIFPAVQKVRANADKILCENKLQQMGLAFHHYHLDYGKLPPGCTDGTVPFSPAMPFLAWSARLLPYMEQDTFWQEIVANYQAAPNFLVPKHNLRYRPLDPFHCPSDERIRISGIPGLLSYMGSSGINYLPEYRTGTLYVNSAVRFADIRDGLTNTLLVGERPPSADGRYGWWYAGVGQAFTGSLDSVLGVRELVAGYPSNDGCPPGPYSFKAGTITNQCDVFHYWSLHPGGANFLFADGSVRFLNYSADAIMPALATRAGGEAVQLD